MTFLTNQGGSITPTLILSLFLHVSIVVAVNFYPCDLSCCGLSSLASGLLKFTIVFSYGSEGSGACAVNRVFSQPSPAVVSR